MCLESKKNKWREEIKEDWFMKAAWRTSLRMCQGWWSVRGFLPNTCKQEPLSVANKARCIEVEVLFRIQAATLNGSVNEFTCPRVAALAVKKNNFVLEVLLQFKFSIYFQVDSDCSLNHSTIYDNSLSFTKLGMIRRKNNIVLTFQYMKLVKSKRCNCHTLTPHYFHLQSFHI